MRLVWGRPCVGERNRKYCYGSGEMEMEMDRKEKRKRMETDIGGGLNPGLGCLIHFNGHDG